VKSHAPSGSMERNRGSSWLKIKPAHTLDLVVLAAEWGSGRRRGWLSNLHLGARDTAHPGQFVMLKAAAGVDPLLRRPFSVFEIIRDRHGTASAITVLSKRIGPSTSLIYDARPGQHMMCLGPLGRPFTVIDPPAEAWMIAGALSSYASERKRQGAARREKHARHEPETVQREKAGKAQHQPCGHDNEDRLHPEAHRAAFLSTAPVSARPRRAAATAAARGRRRSR